MTESAAQRDAASLTILGTFFVVLGVLVLIATWWAVGNTRAMLVNLASGAVLTAVGAVMLTVAGRLRRRARAGSEDD